MELCRILVLAVVFLETSSTITSSTRGVLLQQQQQRLVSFGEDGSATPGVVMMGGGGHHQQQQQQSEGTTTGLRNRQKLIHTNGLKSHIIRYLNRSESEQSSSSSHGNGQRPEVGRKKGATHNNDLRRDNRSRTEERKHKIISFGEKG